VLGYTNIPLQEPEKYEGTKNDTSNILLSSLAGSSQRDLKADLLETKLNGKTFIYLFFFLFTFTIIEICWPDEGDRLSAGDCVSMCLCNVVVNFKSRVDEKKS